MLPLNDLADILGKTFLICMICMIYLMLPDGCRIICIIYRILPGWDLYYTDQTLHNILYENGRLVSTVDYLDRDLSHQSDVLKNFSEKKRGIP